MRGVPTHATQDTVTDSRRHARSFPESRTRLANDSGPRQKGKTASAVQPSRLPALTSRCNKCGGRTRGGHGGKSGYRPQNRTVRFPPPRPKNRKYPGTEQAGGQRVRTRRTPEVTHTCTQAATEATHAQCASHAHIKVLRDTHAHAHTRNKVLGDTHARVPLRRLLRGGLWTGPSPPSPTPTPIAPSSPHSHSRRPTGAGEAGSARRCALPRQPGPPRPLCRALIFPGGSCPRPRPSPSALEARAGCLAIPLFCSSVVRTPRCDRLRVFPHSVEVVRCIHDTPVPSCTHHTARCTPHCGHRALHEGDTHGSYSRSSADALCGRLSATGHLGRISAAD